MDYFHINLSDDKVKTVSSLGLAHVGDGVYELMVRSWMCVQGKATNRGLHKATVAYVSAPAQAESARKIMPFLTEKEQEVFRRGRNTNPHSIAKSATREQYQTSTGIEALFGYLWLKGETDRLNELFTMIMDE